MMTKENSQSVSSTNGFNGALDITSLTDDELFEKLKDLGYNPGPVTTNTRRVYEKKLVRLINGESQDSQGSSVSLNTNSELEMGRSVKNTERSVTPQPSSSSVKAREPSREPSAPRQFVPAVPTHRISYIEKVSSVSSQRVIEPIGELPYGFSPELRQRNFIGSWSPNVGDIKVASAKQGPSGSSSKTLLIIGGNYLETIS